MMASGHSSSFPPRKSALSGSKEPSASLTTLAEKNAAELLTALGGLADRLANFELGDEATAPAVLNAAATLLADELSLALELLRALERLSQTGGEDGDVTFADENDLGQRPCLVTAGSTPPRVADVCFAGALELSRAGQRILPGQDAEATCVAAETALRKLRRVILAVLQAAEAEGTASIGSAEHLRRHQAADLCAALEVRRLYARFRQSLRRSEGEDTEAVLKAVRYSAGALAVLVASPAYAHARASDRALLRRLRERMLAWSRNGRDAGLGLQLLDDIWTCADLLRGMNRRQELRAHDSTSIAALLEAPAGSNGSFAERLMSLRGLDDDLDGLIAEWRRSPSAATERPLTARLEHLRSAR